MDLDTAIHVRWVLRDIRAGRMKLSPSVRTRTSIEMALIEMRDDVPVLTGRGGSALD